MDASATYTEKFNGKNTTLVNTREIKTAGFDGGRPMIVKKF
jgi:hypothetical protein